MSFKIALLDFEEYEEKLFVQQLKTVRKHTNSDWVFHQDSQVSNYIIEHGQLENKAFIYKSNEKSIQYEIDWPVRLFGLLEVLKNYEKSGLSTYNQVEVISTNLSSNSNAVSSNILIEYLVELKSNFAFQINDIYFFINKKDDQVLANVKDFEELLNTLLTVDSMQSLKSYSYSLDDDFLNKNLVYMFSFKKIIWSLFLNYKKSLSSKWAENNSLFKINAWPLYSDFENTANLLRLAAVFTRQYTSIAQAAAFSQLSEIDVIAFLQACEAIGVSVDIDNKDSVKKPNNIKEVKSNKSNSLLFKLRSKLGLAFGR